MSKIIDQNALVKFDPELLKKRPDFYPFKEKDYFVFLGEIYQIPGRCIVSRISDGHVFSCYYTEDFIQLRQNEC